MRDCLNPLKALANYNFTVCINGQFYKRKRKEKRKKRTDQLSQQTNSIGNRFDGTDLLTTNKPIKYGTL